MQPSHSNYENMQRGDWRQEFGESREQGSGMHGYGRESSGYGSQMRGEGREMGGRGSEMYGYGEEMRGYGPEMRGYGPEMYGGEMRYRPEPFTQQHRFWQGRERRGLIRRFAGWIGATLQSWAEQGARGFERAGERARELSERGGARAQRWIDIGEHRVGEWEERAGERMQSMGGELQRMGEPGYGPRFGGDGRGYRGEFRGGSAPYESRHGVRDWQRGMGGGYQQRGYGRGGYEQRPGYGQVGYGMSNRGGGMPLGFEGGGRFEGGRFEGGGRFQAGRFEGGGGFEGGRGQEQAGYGFGAGTSPYFGRGPKGYRRSDDRIREDACEALSSGDLDASNIEVEVDEGELTLRGQVERREWKRMAEDLVEQVIGVRDVHNQLRVESRMEERSGLQSPYTGMGEQPRH